MNKHTITLALALLIAGAANAQNVTRDKDGNFHAITTERQAAPHDSTTSYTYTDKWGKTWPVYKGRKGGLYVWYPNAKGTMRKVYLRTEAEGGKTEPTPTKQ